ncbi:MAG: 4'-phosphopantetheinyl transferase family protein [Candidatus Coproplasma sp.]
MIELYWTRNVDVHAKLKVLLARKLGYKPDILRTANGKPYIEGDPLHFSLSHSRNHAVIAFCDKPIGIDLEFYDSARNVSHVLARFSGNERDEIGDCKPYFYINWMIKEAYIKMTGGTLARDLKRLEYYNRKLYVDGKESNCSVGAYANFSAGLYALCSADYTYSEISSAHMKLFRLKKGESL